MSLKSDSEGEHERRTFARHQSTVEVDFYRAGLRTCWIGAYFKGADQTVSVVQVIEVKR
jgi:hypothetical protein